jgi:FkbM family methyltransferase
MNLKKILKRIYYSFKPRKDDSNSPEKIQYKRCKPWFAVKGDATLRLNYNLNSESIVFDLGGFKGEFSSDIFCKYESFVFVFEPVTSFFKIIKTKFSENKKVTVFPFGLSSENGTFEISDSDNSSSVFIKSENSELIELKSINEFIKQNSILNVNLIKINIEGGEYDVLESLISKNNIQIFDNIQVQFHDFIIENAQGRMQAIQKQLSQTHYLTYQFEFVWENWKRK